MHVMLNQSEIDIACGLKPHRNHRRPFFLFIKTIIIENTKSDKYSSVLIKYLIIIIKGRNGHLAFIELGRIVVLPN